MKNDKRFLTSVCFIRKYGWPGTEKDRLTSLKKQIEYNNRYNVTGTYLMQYDSLIDSDYRSLVKDEEEQGAEAGFWFEVVEPLALAAGLKWCGREGWKWDYYVNPGFLMAYNKEEKYYLIDEAMNKFKEYFGYYPATVGSWLMDSESMTYMSEKYHTNAFILCREQWGMDGYTLWGGPYYGGYYPSKNNALCPAQTDQEQIPTPVFRMYVNDPIYCYYEYAKKKYNDIDYGLFTQEPGWECGQNPDWIDWHYRNTFNDSNVGFLYTQLGQENSFQWGNSVERGLPMQHEYINTNREKYALASVTFAELGRRFQKEYKKTPAMSRAALEDWAGKGNKSVWYNTAYYRINIFSDSQKVWIRDIHLFDEKFRDIYLDTPCTQSWAVYDNLPVVDGIRFSDDDTQAGLFFGSGTIQSVEDTKDFFCVKISLQDQIIQVRLYEDYIAMCSRKEFAINFRYKENSGYIQNVGKNKIQYDYRGFGYELEIEKGSIINNQIVSAEMELLLRL